MSQNSAPAARRVVPINEVNNEIEEDLNSDVVESPSFSTAIVEQETRGLIDIQVATAKNYPRSIPVFKQAALEMATADEDTAAECFYSITRGGKTIEGPSTRLAEIIASTFGNLRIGASIIGSDDTFITAKGQAWDIETNVAIEVTVRRRITDKDGRTFNEDMQMVTGNAAIAIAMRNAIFKIVPRTYTRALFQAARATAIGDIQTLSARRAKAVETFGKMGIQPEQLCTYLKIAEPEEIGLDQIAALRGLLTALRDGSTTLEANFPEPAKAPKPEAPVAGAKNATAAKPDATKKT